MGEDMDSVKMFDVFCEYVIMYDLVERYRELYTETGDTGYLAAVATAMDWIEKELI